MHTIILDAINDIELAIQKINLIADCQLRDYLLSSLNNGLDRMYEEATSEEIENIIESL